MRSNRWVLSLPECVQDSHDDGSKDYQRIQKRFGGKQDNDSVDGHWASCRVYGLCYDRTGGIPSRDVEFMSLSNSISPTSD